MPTVDELRAVKRRHSADLLRRPGVCGVDIEVDAAGEASLAIHLDAPPADVRATLPDHLEGYPIAYIYTGPIEKQ